MDDRRRTRGDRGRLRSVPLPCRFWKEDRVARGSATARATDAPRRRSTPLPDLLSGFPQIAIRGISKHLHFVKERRTPASGALRSSSPRKATKLPGPQLAAMPSQGPRRQIYGWAFYKGFLKLILCLCGDAQNAAVRPPPRLAFARAVGLLLAPSAQNARPRCRPKPASARRADRRWGWRRSRPR